MRNESLGLILVIVLLMGIVGMNRWIMREVEQASEIPLVSPQLPSSENVQISQIAVERSPLIDPNAAEMNMPASTPVQEVEPAVSEENGEQKDKKVIYEMPLEDVNLVQ